MHRLRPSVLVSALLVSAVIDGCTSSPELVVAIDADPLLREGIHTLVLEVDGVEATRTTADEPPTWPTLVRLEVESPRDVLLMARALRGARPELVTMGTVRLPADGRTLVRLHFHSGCAPEVVGALACPADQRCECPDGECDCLSGDQLALTPVPYDPETVRDGGGELDAGPDAPTCTNGTMDGDESDRDCGGSCPGCLAAQSCRTASDCRSRVCGVEGVCLPRSCTNRVLDVGEVDVDCGGSCEPCAVGLRCEVAAHCASGVCQEERCRPATCGDRDVGGDETDVDCGGSCGACVDGAACVRDTDCASLACRGQGVCRDACFVAFGSPCTELMPRYLKSDMAAHGDRFGEGLALGEVAGDRMLAVGAVWDQRGVGSVYVYESEGAERFGRRTRIDSPLPGGEFGRSLAFSGDRLIVGARGFRGLRGAAVVYRYTAGRWEEDSGGRLHDLVPMETPLVPEDRFGSSVAGAGEWIAVGLAGELNERDARVDSRLFLFRLVEGVWTYAQTLEPPVSGEDYRFGAAIAMSADLLVVGAPGDGTIASGPGVEPSEDGLTDSGGVYIYRRTGTTWALDTFIKADAANRNEEFGESVSLFGSWLLVGAPREHSSARGVLTEDPGAGSDNAGAAYLFRHDGSAWEQVAFIKAANTAEFQNFGSAVVMGDGEFVVSAIHESGAGPLFAGDAFAVPQEAHDESGAVYVFRDLPELGWRQVLYIKAPVVDLRDEFGRALALAPDALVVGVPNEDSGDPSDPMLNSDPAESAAGPDAYDSGAAYWFDLRRPRGTEVCDGFDDDGDGVVDEDPTGCSVPCVNGACVGA